METYKAQIYSKTALSAVQKYILTERMRKVTHTINIYI